MPAVIRLLPPVPFADLADYRKAGGGVALDQARRVAPQVIIDEVAASGLRGRGGAGFPTGEKWRTVVQFGSDVLATSVVVNAAEGEPSTFKDRTLMLANPYAILEGALIAAYAVGANDVYIAIKDTFAEPRARMAAALAEITAAGWLDQDGGPVNVSFVDGPSRYLFGEETAMLEVVEGRPPLPRVAPPFRRGTVDVIDDDPADEHVPVRSTSTTGPESSGADTASDVVLASDSSHSEAPPALANNAETLANVPMIISRGAAWFRSVGTDKSPGTILATATGAVRRHGVYELAMGSPLSELIDLAGGPTEGVTLVGMLGGVSNTFLADLEATMSYEGMIGAGSALGSASFHFVGNDEDPLALAAGVSRFLAVESCAQCTPCKVDGLEISLRLAKLVANEGGEADVDVLRRRLSTVADGARCNLGRQHQSVVTSLLDRFPDALAGHLSGSLPATEPAMVAAVIDIQEDIARIDDSIVTADPGWSGLQTDVIPPDAEP